MKSISIQRAVKTMIQKFYDTRLFDNLQKTDKVLEVFLVTIRRRGNLSEQVMMLLNDFVHKQFLKNKATSNTKKYEVMKNLGLHTKMEIYLRVGPFSSDIGIVKLQPLKGTRWLCYIKKKFSDSYGCVCPKKLSKFIIKRNGYCLDSEQKIQGLTSKRDSYCASYCLYLFYLTKVIGINF